MTPPDLKAGECYVWGKSCYGTVLRFCLFVLRSRKQVDLPYRNPALAQFLLCNIKHSWVQGVFPI